MMREIFFCGTVYFGGLVHKAVHPGHKEEPDVNEQIICPIHVINPVNVYHIEKKMPSVSQKFEGTAMLAITQEYEINDRGLLALDF